MAKSTSKTNTITLEGAFSSIQGLNFDGKKIKNGRELIKDNLFNIQVQEIQSGSKAEILARMFRTTSINETPYVVQFVVDMNTRKVEKSTCSCAAGESAMAMKQHMKFIHTILNVVCARFVQFLQFKAAQ